MSQFDELPAEVQSQIKALAKSSESSDIEETCEKMAEGWLEKMKAFEDEISAKGLVEEEEISKNDKNAIIALTYSGSFINLFPVENEGDGTRKIGYKSIGMRTNVPDATEGDGALEEDLKIDSPAVFASGPIQKTSKLYKIAVCPSTMDEEEQAMTIIETADNLAEEFTRINQDIQE